MKVQAINANNYQQNKPNFKALYFSKTVPTLKHNFENQKITATGLKYVEDTSAKLTQEMKEAIAENHFIKRVAEKFDTFVQYIGTEYRGEEFDTIIKVNIVSQNQKARDIYAYQGIDKLTPEGSRLKALANMTYEKHFYHDHIPLDYEIPPGLAQYALAKMEYLREKENNMEDYETLLELDEYD